MLFTSFFLITLLHNVVPKFGTFLLRQPVYSTRCYAERRALLKLDHVDHGSVLSR